MKEIKKTVEVKEGRNWVENYCCTDPAEVYKDLALAMISKKINCCSYIRSIKRAPNYDGTQNIIIQYNNDCRVTFTVEDH